jgi:hypothetical protein
MSELISFVNKLRIKKAIMGEKSKPIIGGKIRRI